MGTFFGIAIARTKWPVVPSFVLLSCGYLYASRREVDSVVLPYLNRARLAYTAQRYLETGVVPDPQEANRNEPMLPWRDQCGHRRGPSLCRQWAIHNDDAQRSARLALAASSR